MLKNKKREFLYAFSSFGPDFMFAMIIAYFLSSVNPSMFGESAHVYAWRSHAIVSTASFGVLFFISRVVDALIDIPYAARLDKIKCKYARLRLPVLISIIPLTAATIALCLPVSFSQGSIANTIYFFVALVVFFAAYTLYMIAYRSGVTSFSRDRKQRIRVSYFKSFLDTVRFAMVYPLTMLVLSLIADTSLNVMHITLMSTPLLLTMLIPLFLTKSKKGDESAQAALLESNSENSIEKSGETATVFACEESAAAEQADTSLAASVQEAKDQSALTTAAIQPVQKQKIGILSSLKLVITTKAFWPWMIVAFLYFMGLQLFLSTQNELISGVLWLTPAYAALLNSAAFGPVPIMLFLFNKVMKKKGIRFALQVGLVTFALGVMCFSLGSAVTFPNSIVPRIVINMIGGTISGFSIGAFFMMFMMIPSQVAAAELKVAKRGNTAMYFAGQSVALGIGGALATGIIADSILRNLGSFEVASAIALEGSYRIPIGGFIAPFIVGVLCFAAFGVSFLMPKCYDIKTIGKLFDKNYCPDEEDLADCEIVKRKSPKSQDQNQIQN